MFLSTPVLYKFGITLIISTQLLMLYLGYLLFFPFTPLVVKNPNNLTVTPTVVKAGDPMMVEFNYCKDKYYRVKVDKQVVGKTQAYNLPTSNDTVLPVGCHIYTVSHLVPEDIVSGTYYIAIDVDYEVNPLRVIHYSLQTEPFVVEGGEK